MSGQRKDAKNDYTLAEFAFNAGQTKLKEQKRISIVFSYLHFSAFIFHIFSILSNYLLLVSMYSQFSINALFISAFLS
jgi:hypothetical protein